MLSSSGSRSSLKEKSKKRDTTSENEEAVENVDQLAWRVLDKTDTTELAGMDDPDQIAMKLAVVMGLNHHEENLSDASLLDYYVATYWFAREHKFTEEQTSTLFTITHTLITNLKDQHLSLQDNIQQLRGLLAAGVGLSPQQTALQCLTPEIAKLVVECVTTGLFQHYRLFQYLFEEQQSELQINLSLQVDVPPLPSTFIPPPLDEAIPLELYERCLAPKPADVVVQEDRQPTPNEEEDQVTVDPSSIVSDWTQEESEVLKKVSPEELKAVMESLTSDTLLVYQTEVFKKLQEKEEMLISRLSKLKNTYT